MIYRLTWKHLILVCTSLLLAWGQATVANGQTGTVVARLVGCGDFQQGAQVVVTVQIDMSGVTEPFPCDKLGSFNGTLDWDTNYLTYVSHSGILSGFIGIVIVSSGHIDFNGANPSGAGGLVDVLAVTFQVSSDPVICETSSSINLEFSSMSDPICFISFLPILQVEDCNFFIYCGIPGDVNEDDTVNSTDALIMLSCDVGIDVSWFCPMNCGDVNGDGLINSTDALIILSYDVGIPVPFCVGPPCAGQPGCPSNVTPCPGCNK